LPHLEATSGLSRLARSPQRFHCDMFRESVQKTGRNAEHCFALPVCGFPPVVASVVYDKLVQFERSQDFEDIFVAGADHGAQMDRRYGAL
jgi:hypothetical protein